MTLRRLLSIAGATALIGAAGCSDTNTNKTTPANTAPGSSSTNATGAPQGRSPDTLPRTSPGMPGSPRSTDNSGTSSAGSTTSGSPSDTSTTPSTPSDTSGSSS